eukprot:m51a1_g10208 putative cathepsin b (610) ;mRNA; f:78032-80756
MTVQEEAEPLVHSEAAAQKAHRRLLALVSVAAVALLCVVATSSGVIGWKVGRDRAGHTPTPDCRDPLPLALRNYSLRMVVEVSASGQPTKRTETVINRFQNDTTILMSFQDVGDRAVEVFQVTRDRLGRNSSFRGYATTLLPFFDRDVCHTLPFPAWAVIGSQDDSLPPNALALVGMRKQGWQRCGTAFPDKYCMVWSRVDTGFFFTEVEAQKGESWLFIENTNVPAMHVESSTQRNKRTDAIEASMTKHTFFFSPVPDMQAFNLPHRMVCTNFTPAGGSSGALSSLLGARWRHNASDARSDEQSAGPVNGGEAMARVLSAPKAWEAGRNSFFDGSSFKDVARMLREPARAVARAPQQRQPSGAQQRRAPRAVPQSFDARERWPECEGIGLARDQGTLCGACWAFAASGALADRLCIASSGRLASNWTLSPQWMISCFADQDGCSGGNSDTVWADLRDVGAVAESCLPYDPVPSAQQCPTRCADGSNLVLYRVSDAYSPFDNSSWEGTVSLIQQEILEQGPVEAAIVVFDDLLYYKSGVYDVTPGSSFVGNHAVKVVGWGTTEAGTPFWTCVNSWGTSWGDSGVFRVRRGTNAVGIEDRVSAGRAVASQ